MSTKTQDPSPLPLSVTSSTGTILDHADNGLGGIFRPGLHIVCGPQGCGKTTLLEAITDSMGITGFAADLYSSINQEAWRREPHLPNVLHDESKVLVVDDLDRFTSPGMLAVFALVAFVKTARRLERTLVVSMRRLPSQDFLRLADWAIELENTGSAADGSFGLSATVVKHRTMAEGHRIPPMVGGRTLDKRPYLKWS